MEQEELAFLCYDDQECDAVIVTNHLHSCPALKSIYHVARHSRYCVQYFTKDIYIYRYRILRIKLQFQVVGT